MRLLDRGTHSNIDGSRQVVVRDAAAWGTLWKQHAGDRPMPVVDFSKEAVAAVFLGTRSTGGYGVAIAGGQQKAGAFVVEYRETSPGPGAIAAQVITSPFSIVAMPKVDGDVKFERVQ
jgi:hypothetical protein